jgi:16S rRNA (guanine527-N7)-methyltransferase
MALLFFTGIIVSMKDLERYAYALAGLKLTPAQQSAFKRYEDELLDWNKRVNLTAIRDPQQIHMKHFLDSLTCLCAMRDTHMERVVDVGAGAGFPGMPLKIACPGTQLTLIESVGKKADFCRHIATTLKLEGVEVVKARAEEVGRMPAYRQQFDWAIARAVAVLPVLAEFLLPLVRVGGAMLAMKGESAAAEAQSSENAIRLLGGHLKQLIPITLPGVVEEHFLVVINKVAATPDIYPRRVGVPVKRPL